MLPMLFIHGFPLDGSMWQAQVGDLGAASAGGKRTVLAPDLPGFGVKPSNPAPVPDQASIENYAEHIHRLIHAQCGGRAVVGGLSMGGYILLALLRNHPGDVAAAMFLDTRADADTAEARAGRLKSIDDIRQNGPAGLFEAMTTKLLSKNPALAMRQHVRAIMDRQSAEALVAAQSAMSRRRDQTDLLATLSIPVLIVVGAEDAVTPPAVARSMQGQMPQAMLVEIPAAGHLSPIEQPGAVNGAIRGFLAAHGL